MTCGKIKTNPIWTWVSKIWIGFKFIIIHIDVQMPTFLFTDLPKSVCQLTQLPHGPFLLQFCLGQAHGAWWLDVLEDLAAEFLLGTMEYCILSKCQVWIGLISFYYTCMGHKLRNTLYITSTENPIVHRASQDLPIGGGLRRLEMGCQKGASESSYTRPVFPNMDLQREIEDFDGLFFVRISFLEVCFCYSWWKKWGSKTGTVAHRKTWGEHILTEKTNTPGV